MINVDKRGKREMSLSLTKKFVNHKKSFNFTKSFEQI